MTLGVREQSAGSRQPGGQAAKAAGNGLGAGSFSGGFREECEDGVVDVGGQVGAVAAGHWWGFEEELA